MVAVSHRDADRFISGALGQMDVFLVFGTDAGLVSERTSTILRRCGVNPANPDQIIRLDGDDLASNPGKLVEEAHGMGLFVEKRAIIIRAGGKQIGNPLEAILESPAPDCKIVIQAGALRRDAPLRKLAERARNAAAIECYPDQARDIERLIDSSLKDAGLAIESEARNMLVELLGDDRLSTRSELEKLILYAHGCGRITENDVLNAVADTSAFALDNIIFSAFSGDIAFLGNAGAEIYSTTSELFSLLAAATRHAHMLHQILIETENGSRVEEAIDRHAGRAVFGARKDMLIRQAKQWRREDIAICIDHLGRSILDMRKEPTLADSIVMHTLLIIARRFRMTRNAR